MKIKYLGNIHTFLDTHFQMGTDRDLHSSKFLGLPVPMTLWSTSGIKQSLSQTRIKSPQSLGFVIINFTTRKDLHLFVPSSVQRAGGKTSVYRYMLWGNIILTWVYPTSSLGGTLHPSLLQSVSGLQLGQYSSMAERSNSSYLYCQQSVS